MVFSSFLVFNIIKSKYRSRLSVFFGVCSKVYLILCSTALLDIMLVKYGFCGHLRNIIGTY